jgi:predicted Zn-dependent protease with MMP-like domain
LFREHLENVRIVIDDVPSRAQRERTGYGHDSLLLGLYEGVPLTHRTTHYGVAPTVPDTITLFQRNIERIAATDDGVREEIRVTLIHEIAHYYGMDEDKVRAAGY